jgi:neutral amino acid transport system permease protein
VEAGATTQAPQVPLRERLREARIVRLASAYPERSAVLVLALIVLALVAAEGLHDVAQKTVFGLSLGSIYALGAVGLTLVYGVLKLVNFAHGDFLTFGAFMAYLASVTWGGPIVPAVLFAIVLTAVLGILFEKTMWGPMRVKRAGLLQLVLMSIGLAFVIRFTIQYFWGTQIRILDVDRTSTVEFLGITVGQTRLIVIIVGFVVLLSVGLLLKLTLLGKRMRALADNLDLAETAGIDTSRTILYTWLFAGGLAGLAGAMAGAIIDVQPTVGFDLLLPIFAAVVLGGIGDAFGALASGIILGVVTEWSTFFIGAQWKIAVGFAVLIVILIIRPQGIFGQAKTV